MRTVCVAVASNLALELLKTGIEPSTLLSPLNSKPAAAGPCGPAVTISTVVTSETCETVT